MPKSAKRHQDPYRKRKCKLCKLEFSPTTKIIKNAEAQEFCCEAHRKEFWKYGALPFAKLMARIEKRCREIAREEIAAAFERFFTTRYSTELDDSVLVNTVPWFEITKTEQHHSVPPESPQSV